MPDWLEITFISIAVTAAVTACVYLFWWARSQYKIKKAGPSPVHADHQTIWRDPGSVEHLDFRAGPGGPDGAPVPPFRFLTEHLTGSNPTVSVGDARGRTWRVKWGDEVRTETFASRLVWAAGFHVENTHFLPEGHIQDVTGLKRAKKCVGEDGTFKDARFKLDEEGVQKMFDEHGWAWDDNPFAGTRELNGLKVMLMLTANWDNKDVRDVARGSNTAIFQSKAADGTTEARYLIIDWGAAMGKWGTSLTRGRWDCAGYAAQTPQFVKGVTNGLVQWGFIGQRTFVARGGISIEDVKWLYQYVGRITDEQLSDGLSASGATAEEIACFTKALRQRLNVLRQVCEMGEGFKPSGA